VFAALVNEIKYEAVRMAQASPGKRLDPLLGLFLDEVTQVAPVPLNKSTPGGTSSHPGAPRSRRRQRAGQKYRARLEVSRAWRDSNPRPVA
jgi:hypothetical protein